MTEEEFKYGSACSIGVLGDSLFPTIPGPMALSVKDTNPKDSVGVRKAGMSCVPSEVLMELGLAMQEGARKYGRHNYRIAGVRASVYYDAALRHLMAWWEGEDIDPDSGLSHLVKAMACCLVIRDSIFYGGWVDDRPPSLNSGWQGDLNKKASDLIDRMPISKDAYVRDSLDQFINDWDADPVQTCCATTWTKGIDRWGIGLDRELIRALDSTDRPQLPLLDNPVQPASQTTNTPLPFDSSILQDKHWVHSHSGGKFVVK